MSSAMPEPTQQTAAKADDQCELGTVVGWSGRYGFVRPDRGGSDVYLSGIELARAGIERLKIGSRISFEIRKASYGRKPWAARIRLAEPAS
jgi:cold shock CspA family protein